MRSILIAGALVLITSPVAADLVADAVVYIEARPKVGGQTMRGSGFLISAGGYMLTARHLFEGYPAWSGEILVSLKARSRLDHKAQIVDCATGGTDLCLLKIPEADISAANITHVPFLSCRDLEIGEPVTAIGYPPGDQNPTHRPAGRVTSGIGHQLLQLSDLSLAPGMSGGPVLDKEGKVVGVVAGAFKDHEQLSFFTPLIQSRPLLLKTSISCSDQLSSLKTQKDEASNAWAAIGNTNSCGVLDIFLKKYTYGIYADFARVRQK